MRKLRKINGITLMSIILFLVISISWYMDLGYEENEETILFIVFLIFFFMVGGLVGLMSDGINVPRRSS